MFKHKFVTTLVKVCEMNRFDWESITPETAHGFVLYCIVCIVFMSTSKHTTNNTI